MVLVKPFYVMRAPSCDWSTTLIGRTFSVKHVHSGWDSSRLYGNLRPLNSTQNTSSTPPCLAVGLTLRPLVVLYQRRSSSKATLPSSFSAYQERQGYMALLDGTSVSSSRRETYTNVAHSCPNSLAVGFLLSILGSIVLFVGQLGLFAGTCSSSVMLLLNLELRTVLYVLGTIVSLIGTGFLIGVSLKCFAEIA